MRISNTPAGMTFIFTDNEKEKIEETLGKEDRYQFTAIEKNRFKITDRETGDGFLQLSLVTRRLSKNLWRVTVRNMAKEMIGDHYGQSEGTLELKGDSLEITINEKDKAPYKARGKWKPKSSLDPDPTSGILDSDDFVPAMTFETILNNIDAENDSIEDDFNSFDDYEPLN